MPKHFTNAKLDEDVIMPNHFHGIIQANEFVGAKQESPALPVFDLRGNFRDVSGKGKAGETFALPLRDVEIILPPLPCS